MTTHLPMSAAERYAARVDAVMEQRTRFRGPEPPGDLFDGIAPNHPLLSASPHEPLSPNVSIIAEYIPPDSVVVDVGGGAGRISLPLAVRCARVINVEPSGAMVAAFRRNAQAAGIGNVEAVVAPWESAEPPQGTIALVNHVLYLTRDIVPFLKKLERAASDRVVITVGSQPPPSRSRVVYEQLYGEPECIAPTHAELVDVLWEIGRLPDVRVLPEYGAPLPRPVPTREAAIEAGVAAFQSAQWTFWPMPVELDARLRALLEARFEQLFTESDDGYVPSWFVHGREVLITWRPGIDVSSQTGGTTWQQ
jgi:hypothetical protein